MPLVDLMLPSDSDGWFWMEEPVTGKRVQVEVERAAIDDARGRQGRNYVPLLATFSEVRPKIAEIASRKFDSGQLTDRGSILVKSRDLNPELFAA